MEMWTVYNGSALVVQFSVLAHGDGTGWDGRWPIREGATYGVFLIVNPGSFWRQSRLVDPPLRRRLGAAEKKLAALVEQLRQGPRRQGRYAVEVHRLFYDEEASQPEFPSNEFVDEGEVIVYQPPD